MEKKSKDISSVIDSVDALIRSVQSTYECLSFDTKRIKPSVEALQRMSSPESEKAAMAMKDLVNRLTAADDRLSEAMCLIGDALSSISIGSKNYKESV